MKAHLIRATVFAVAVFIASSASATTIHSGLLSTSNGGVLGTGDWSGTGNNGFQVDYTVDLTGSTYTYTYAFSGVGGTLLEKALSHAIIEVSDNFTDDNILPGTTSPWELRSAVYSPNKPTWEDLGAAGIKWNTTGDPQIFTATIVTDRAPMLGDFFAKDGTGTSATSTASAILHVPDTLSVVVPLPAAAWMGMMLLGGVGGAGYIRRRRLAGE